MFGPAWQFRAAWQRAVGVYLAGVIFTTIAALATNSARGKALRQRAALDSLSVAGDLRTISQAHTALLSALRSLYRVNHPLTRRQFHDFVSGGRLLEQHPGAQALEFARRVPGDELSRFEDRLRRDDAIPALGYPPVEIISGEGSGDSWIVDYLEPVVGNEAAYLLDLAAEPSRRRAIRAACAGNRTVATASVRLVQESGDSPGLVVFSPVYEADPPAGGEEQRLEACTGLMIVVYRAADMLSTIRTHGEFNFHVVDAGAIDEPNLGDQGPGATLLYDSGGGSRGADARQVSTATVPFEFHGRQWIIRVQSAVPPTATPLAVPGVVALGLSVTTIVAGLVLQLATSRRRAITRLRVFTAGERDRRSLERDLHDGAQQRLLATSLILRKARAQVPAGSHAAELVDLAAEELGRSLQELRELAEGLHPAVLSDHGLAVAAESMVSRAPVPVDLHLGIDGRLPLPVEVTAYYVLCESLANAAKHARASRITVDLREAGSYLLVEIRDDGLGSARIGAGSGLQGLADRVEALDGHFSVTSPPGGGTCIRAMIPSR